jgi:hypothetical protein
MPLSPVSWSGSELALVTGQQCLSVTWSSSVPPNPYTG